MIPYFVLVFMPAAFSLIAVQRRARVGYTFRIGRSTSISSNSLAVPFFFFLLFLLLALRDETIGRDLPNYHYYFRVYSEQSIKELSTSWYEILFRWLNWLIGRITSSFQWYLAIMAAVVIIPIARIYSEDRRRSYLKIVLFVNMSTFAMLFSGIRQSIAMAIGMMAYSSVRRRKIVPFIVATLMAILVHHSGFMILLMYPLYRIRFKRRHLLFIVPLIAAILVFNGQIFGLLSTILSEYSDKYDSIATSTGAYGSLLLFAVLTVFCFVIVDDTTIDEETLGLRNFLLLVVAIQCFAAVSPLVMRLNYYYILFIPVLLPKVIEVSRGDRKQIGQVGEYVMCLFFTLYFMIRIYTAYKTGNSPLDTVPYLPFWAK